MLAELRPWLRMGLRPRGVRLADGSAWGDAPAIPEPDMTIEWAAAQAAATVVGLRHALGGQSFALHCACGHVTHCFVSAAAFEQGLARAFAPFIGHRRNGCHVMAAECTLLLSMAGGGESKPAKSGKARRW